MEIRQALAYAIDEAKLVDAAYGISGYVHDSIFPKGSLGDSQNDTQYTQDLEKAKSLIESKGYTMGGDGFYEKDGQVLEVELMYAESSTQIAEILKEQWSKVGVDATIKMLDFGALIDELTRKSDKDGNLAINGTNYDETTLATDACFDAYLLGFAQESDPNEYAQYFTNDDSWNFYHYHNPEVEVLFADQAKAVDQTERKAILNEISEHLSHDLPWYTYGGVNEIVVTRSDLSGYTPDARGYTMDAHEWKLGE
ncbi:hypothetical protein AN644_00430 [Candidatus Epulonipiscium fishelsonii]|nr:hypothetical protein AN644_00430 [Epulopiscium sp. SCG-C06WGA-EpuloA1]